MTEKENDFKFIAINIPRELHKDFKGTCNDRDTTMKKEIIRMIMEFIGKGDI